jgi:hypothetical protein
MSLEQIAIDLRALAGRQPHRGAQTEKEEAAARYIHGRLLANTVHTDMQSLLGVENPYHILASLYAEFLVVCIVATWWPAAALVYGVLVVAAYVAELHGYSLFNRLLPQCESQNVHARFMGLRPGRLLIVTAYYDSGQATPLFAPRLLPWLRPLHTLLHTCMIVVLATCALAAMAKFHGTVYPIAGTVRWAAGLTLGAAGVAMLWAGGHREDTRGANNNASGVAALLRLADRLKAHPMEDADIWLIALGSHATAAAGIRHLLESGGIDRRTTCFLNLESVGSGALHYLEREGMVRACSADLALTQAAKGEAQPFGATPATLFQVPTAAQLPLLRGYRAMTIMALAEGLPHHWNSPEDTLSNVDEITIARAADFAEAVLRRVTNDDQAGRAL